MARVEVITRTERRRRWSEQEKAAILGEVEAAGGKVAEVARRRGLSEGLLYDWRAKWRKTNGAAAAVPTFVPIGVFSTAADERAAMAVPLPHTAETLPISRPGRSAATIPSLPPDDRAGVMEIELPGGARLRVDALVNERALRRVLRALKDGA